MERTLIATEDGVKCATKAFTALGITQVVFAEERLGCSRTTVSNFFNKKPVERKIFTQICKTLNLEWSEIAEMPEEGTMESVISDVVNETNSTDNSIRLAFAITGTVNQIDHAKLKAIVKVLRQLTGDDLIEIVDIQEGSIKLILTGTPEALAKIQTLYRSGKLSEIKGISVVSTSFEDFSGANLSGVDFSGANLSGVDFSGANLIRTNFRKANLSGANLSGANLSRTNFRRADLSGANLSGANLSRASLGKASLEGANFSGTNLDRIKSGINYSSPIQFLVYLSLVMLLLFISDAEENLETNKRISDRIKSDLRYRGAIFDN
jgi:hypothetical protein